MACSINGSRIGYTHLVMEPAEEDGQPVLRFHYDDQLKLRRFGADTVVSTRLTSLETREGGLLSFRSEMQTGPGAMVSEGRREGDQLKLRTSNQGKVEEHSLPWNKQYGGFFADQLSLRRQPMRPGETRRLQALLPVLNVVGQVRLEAVALEAVELPSGTGQLLRINVTTDIGAAEIKSVLWTDPQGKPHKVKDLQLGMEAVLATREDAQRATSGGGFDLGFDTIVRIDRPLRDPHRTRRVVYRAKLTEGDVKPLFAVGLSQTVRPVEGQAVEVTVQAVRPDQPPTLPGASSDPPTDADRQASTMLQSDDPAVRKMAESVAAGESDAPPQLEAAKWIWRKEGRPVRAVVEMMDFYDQETGFTAMERTTGWDGAIVAAMMARGQIPCGAVPVELAVPADRFVAELSRRGIQVSWRLDVPAADVPGE